MSDCETCGGTGREEWEQDCFDHVSGHYTISRSQPCPACKPSRRRPGRYARRQWKRMRHKRGRWLRAGDPL